MKDDSQSPDNRPELRPRDIVKIREILASRDADGNPRFLDEREVITRALDVFFAWELKPENFLTEINKIEAINLYQKHLMKGMLNAQTLLHNAIERYIEANPKNSFLVEDSVVKEQRQQQVDRESKKDYEKMLENLESSKQIIKQIKMSDLKFDYDEKITYDGWPLLWNFYSRLLPAKIAITALGDLVRIEQQTGIKRGLTPNWVLISDLRRKAYDIAEELAEKLRSYERQKKLGRTEKISTGFPKPVIFDNDKPELQGLAEKRFKDKYVVNIRKNTKTRKQHLEGILAAMGLVTVIKIGKEYFISMTDLGKEFYLLDNPVLNGSYEHAFSNDEVKFITEKLIPQRELEDLLCKKALEIVSSGSDQEDSEIKSSEEVNEETDNDMIWIAIVMIWNPVNYTIDKEFASEVDCWNYYDTGVGEIYARENYGTQVLDHQGNKPDKEYMKKHRPSHREYPTRLYKNFGGELVWLTCDIKV